jgi:antitoxin component HigA of HigAB toxin-antitoxin module
MSVYSQLVAEVTPKVIETDAEYEQVLAGQQLINISQAQALAKRFKLSPQIFLT